MILTRLKFVLLFAWLVLTLTACATPPANSGHSSFSGYAESVFRHQNDINSRLMMLSDADKLPDDDEFQKAEETMTDACHLLNEYAERESNNENIGWRFQSKVQDSVKGCDESVKRMETLMTKPEMKP